MVSRIMMLFSPRGVLCATSEPASSYSAETRREEAGLLKGEGIDVGLRRMCNILRLGG